MIRALRTPLLASFHRDRGGRGRAGDFLFRKENQPLFGRRRNVGNSPLDSVRIKVEFFTSLCPFGETFVHFKSPLWYFLHMCGFTVKAGPYHGRRMILTSPQRLGGMLRQYRTETKTLGRSAESFFRRIRMEPILRIRLQELFDSCLEHESETADIHLHLEGSPADYHAATSSLQSRVEMFLELCTHESDSQSTSSAKLCAAADKGKRRRMQLFPFSRPFCRDLFADGEHHPQRLASTTTTTTTTSHAGDGSHDLYVMPLAPSPTLEIPIEVRRALWRGSTAVTHQTDGGDHLDEASKKEKLCEPITHVFSVPDDHGGSSASVCVTRISQEVLRALAESQFTFTCPLTPPPLPIALSTMCVDDSEGGGSARTEEGSTHPNSVTVAYCHMMLSVGVVEFSDLACSLVQLRRDEANGLLHCTAIKHHVPLFSLATNVCSAVVIANAQFLSHAALHELRASLETNSRTMATAANNHHSMRPAGLLPRWTPLNGGLCVVCIGTFDSSTQAQSNEAPARVAGTENLLHMTLPAFMTDNGNTDRLPNAAREGFSRLIEVLTSVSEESLSVTAVGGSTELCVRESIVQSFLRSTRPISLHAVTALVKSCATGAGVGLLVPEESVPRNTDAPPETQSLDVQSASVIGDMPSLLCIAASTEPQASPVPTIGWKLPQVVAELNQVKILCDDSGSSGLGMARLEKLLNEVPLLKYIAVRHEDTTRFHNLETASTKDCVARLTINSPTAGKNAAGGANPLHLQHVVEKRTKKSGKLHEATSPPTRRIYGTSHNVELVESRQAERVGKEAFRASLVTAAQRNDRHLSPQANISSCMLFSSHLLPPRVSKTFAGVTVIACVHCNTPLRVIEQSVWERVTDALPPFITPAEMFSGVLVFPMDFVAFTGTVRKCVGVRLMVSVDEAVDPQGYKDAMNEALTLLPQAVEQIRRRNFPFAVEAIRPAAFGLTAGELPRPQQETTTHLPPGQQQPTAMIADEEAPPSSADAIAALLELAQSASANHGAIPTSGTTEGDAAINFVCVDESKLLIYPNVVERRLQALAAVTVPDETLCVGQRVLLHPGASVIVMGAMLHGTVENHFPMELWQIRQTAEATTTSAFGVLDGFRWSNEVLKCLSTKRENDLTAVTEAFIGAQRIEDVGFSKLPVVVLPRQSLSPLTVCSTSSGPNVDNASPPEPDDMTGYIVIVLPSLVTVGGRNGLYGYELPVVTLPLLVATHCGMDYRFDGLYAGHSDSLLQALIHKDPFVDHLSSRLSVPVFREPPHSLKAVQESAALVRLAASKALNAQTTIALSGERKAKPEEDVLRDIDQHLCSSKEFTAAVFY